MKKSVKIISAILMVITILTSLSTMVFADVEGDLNKLKNPAPTEATEDLVALGGKIVSIMQTVGVVVAVVVLLILGIKYMMGSAEEKAEYKKTMIPYVIGAILIFASTTIVSVVYNLANGLNLGQ